MNETCGECRYWLEQSHYPTIGSCRRFPPSIAHEVEDYDYPQTLDIDWCGEFKEIVTNEKA